VNSPAALLFDRRLESVSEMYYVIFLKRLANDTILRENADFILGSQTEFNIRDIYRRW
jgi:hypothetical protein